MQSAAGFPSTHWSAVLLAGEGESSRASEALEKLCRGYWYPLYAFVRRSGRDPHTAQYLTWNPNLSAISSMSFAVGLPAPWPGSQTLAGNFGQRRERLRSPLGEKKRSFPCSSQNQTSIAPASK